jgi:hypothetical protein
LLRRHFEPGLPPTSSIGIHGVRLPQARRVAYVGLSHGFPHALPRLVPPVRRGHLRTAQHMCFSVCTKNTHVVSSRPVLRASDEAGLERARRVSVQ